MLGCSHTNNTFAVYNCPVGGPYILNGEVVQCVRRTLNSPLNGGGFNPTQPLVSVRSNQETTSTTNDTCPSNYACFTYGPQLPNVTLQSGHCCMIPREVCPVGEVLQNAICPGAPVLTPGQILCPLASHYCVQPLMLEISILGRKRRLL